MSLPANILHNLEFLQAEVLNRLESIKIYLGDTSPDAAEKIFKRSGYLSNLKQRVHDACYRYIAGKDNSAAVEVSQVRAIDIIADELEQIADLGEEFVQQLVYFEDPDNQNFRKLLAQIDLVIEAVSMVQTALLDNDTQIAVRIGRTHNRLDRKFRKLLKKNAAALSYTTYAEKNITISFSAYAIERKGESLHRIREAIISSKLGMEMDTSR